MRWVATGDRRVTAALEAWAVRAVVDVLVPGVALDAACGTGRHIGYLAEAGHRVIGVDSSPEMLEQARRWVPSADLRVGALEALPVDDDPSTWRCAP